MSIGPWVSASASLSGGSSSTSPDSLPRRKHTSAFARIAPRHEEVLPIARKQLQEPAVHWDGQQ